MPASIGESVLLEASKNFIMEIPESKPNGAANFSSVKKYTLGSITYIECVVDAHLSFGRFREVSQKMDSDSKKFTEWECQTMFANYQMALNA